MPTYPDAITRRFEVRRPLGQGGMGTVVEAYDHLTDSIVALKCVRDSAGHGAEGARLHDECRLLTAFEHPGIMAVHDVVLAGEALWMVSEVVSGQRLDRFAAGLDDADTASALAVTGALLRNLGWLHARGILHGDLKPSNVLVRSLAGEPWPVLIDFGLAQPVETAAFLGGSERFLAPELRRGGRPTIQTDLFALGTALAPLATRFPVLEDMVSALTAEEPQARPATAEAALDTLAAPDAGDERAFGVRDAETLWGQAVLDGLAREAGDGGRHRIALFSADDAPRFARRLSVRLTLLGRPNLVLGDGAGLGRWSVLLRCAAGVLVAVPSRGTAADTVEVADVFANAAIRALETARVKLPTLLVANVDGLSAVERFVLARLIEAGAVAGVVLVDGPQAPNNLGRGLDPSFVRHAVTHPDAAAVSRFLTAHGIRPTAATTALVQARADAGLVGLRAMVSGWVRGGLLTAGTDGAWSLDDATDPRLVDEASEDMDAVWRSLLDRLQDGEAQLIQTLWGLGGGASRAAVEALASEVSPASWVRLAAAGWTQVEAGKTRLTEAVIRRLKSETLKLPAPSEAERRVWIATLRADPHLSLDGAIALAAHLEALGAAEEALACWVVASRRAIGALDAVRAGMALDAASRAAAAAGQPDEAYALAADALAEWIAVGEIAAVKATLARLEALGAALATPETQVRTVSLTARVALRLGDPKAALEAANRGLGLAPGEAQRMDLELTRGTALSQLGDVEPAAEALARSMAAARALGDDHAVGRIGNNLGILEFNLGRFARAAEAWSDASEAKRKTGDRRGERICIGNSALALRELGELAGAHARGQVARTLATEIRDSLGTMMGALGSAQLWLDVGMPTQAEAALAGFTGGGSKLAQADADLLRARIALAHGDMAVATMGALAVLNAAKAAGWTSTVGEAKSLAYLAATRGELLDDPSVAAPLGGVVSGEDPDADADATADAWPTLAACRAHALAVDGQWGASRKIVSAALETLPRPAPPRATDALELYWRATRLTGPVALASALRDRLDEVLATRFAMLRQMGVSPDVSLADLADGLGLPRPDPTSARFMHTQIAQDDSAPGQDVHGPKGTERTMQQQIILDTLTALALDRMGDTRMWADVLMDATGADACLVMAFVDEAPTTVALAGSIDGEDTRFAGVAGRLRRGGAPLLADRGDGRLEVLGMPLRVADDVVGAVFLTWTEPGHGGSPGLADALTPTVACLALAVERGVQGELLTAATEEIARLQAVIEAERDEVTALRDALDESRSQLALHYDYSAIVHESRAFRKVLQTLDKVTDTEIPVLMLGESGVGKEVLSKALHYNGPRRGQRFVAENCGAIPRELFESVFFGHVRGAFTGAHQPKKGLLDAAHQGTLFLDEIGELSLDHQVKLLRVIQEKRYRPVGASRELPADFRLVCATNRDLQAMVAEGTFREDLFYRVAVVSIRIPPLRERREDVLPLVERFLAVQRERLGCPLVLTPEAARRFVAHEWPGNVRELENEVLRASVLSDGEAIREVHLSPRLISEPVAGSRRPGQAGNLWLSGDASLQDVLQMVEAEVVREALTQQRGKKAATARQLGLSRPGLDAKIARHGIDVAAIKAKGKTQ